MTETGFKCARCARTDGQLEAPPLPGSTGREVAERICGSCWQEWEQAEVMVINELRLNFMDPKSLTILEKNMREFLLLGSTAESA